MKTVSVITFGCKVNKNESDAIAHLLSGYGYFVTDELIKADYYIINSCAVTNEGEKKSRQVISKILKLNKNAHIVICGCASENNAEQFKNKLNTGKVIGTKNKETLVDYILAHDNLPIANKGDIKSTIKLSNTRAYLKIQDGCNRFCSYCIIPYLRGRSDSYPVDEVVREAFELSKTSKEIVLVGIDISDYKINGKLALPMLVEKLKAVPSRFRFGSFEVNVISDELLTAMKSAGNFVPHFHLSLQSGDDQTLKHMNRKYTTAHYQEKCNLIKTYFPNANITTDIIVGYPTETNEQFENTVNFAKSIGFGRMHIFPFSVRDGTPAAKLQDLPKKIKQERVKQLSKVAANLSKKFYTSQIDKVREVLIETKSNDMYVGYTDNYIKTYITSLRHLESGEVIPVKLEKIYKDGMHGVVV